MINPFHAEPSLFAGPKAARALIGTKVIAKPQTLCEQRDTTMVGADRTQRGSVLRVTSDLWSGHDAIDDQLEIHPFLVYILTHRQSLINRRSANLLLATSSSIAPPASRPLAGELTSGSCRSCS